ncbi:MAG: heme-binding domain-containing protein [Microthrixaceae bacterium]
MTNDLPPADESRPSGPLRRTVRSISEHPLITIVLVALSVGAVAMSAAIGLNVVVPIVLLGVVGAGALLLFQLWRRSRPAAHRPSSTTSGRVGLAAVAVSGVATFALIQLVPYGRDHTDPPATGEPQWADARTRELMVDACFSCHSNEVEYPAYASVAPLSWAVQHHIDEGREAVNYSEFATERGDADETIEVIEEGEMPPAYYTRFGVHPEANLTDAQLAELIDGLRHTPGLSESD